MKGFAAKRAGREGFTTAGRSDAASGAVSPRVNDRLVFLSLLDVAEIQVDRFVPKESAGEQNGQEKRRTAPSRGLMVPGTESRDSRWIR